MQRDPKRRLGYLRDAEEVKEHRFFNGINWQAVYKKELCPPKVPLIEAPSAGVPAEDIFGHFVNTEVNKIIGWTFINDANGF